MGEDTTRTLILIAALFSILGLTALTVRSASEPKVTVRVIDTQDGGFILAEVSPPVKAIFHSDQPINKDEILKCRLGDEALDCDGISLTPLGMKFEVSIDDSIHVGRGENDLAQR